MDPFATLGLNAFSVQSIRTPLGESTTWVGVADSVAQANNALNSEGFDQAPVKGPDGKLFGWFAAPSASDEGLVGDSFQPLHESLVVGSNSPLAEVLGEVESRKFVFTAGPNGIDGFIVRSDLDRHACRAYFYILISSIEMRLSGWLRSESGMSSESIEDRMNQLERNWFQKATQTNVDLHPAEYLGLRTLIDIFLSASDPRFAASGIGDDLNTVEEIRNEIMHPTKSLVEACTSLSGVDRAARRCIAHFNGAGDPPGLGAWPSPVR